jgi:hypothetical protein
MNLAPTVCQFSPARSPLRLVAGVAADVFELHLAALRPEMWTIQKISKRDGISKQGTSKNVGSLARRGLLFVERNRRGNVIAVDVAAYDRFMGRAAVPVPVAGVTAALRALFETIAFDLRKKFAAAWRALADKGRLLASIASIASKPPDRAV